MSKTSDEKFEFIEIKKSERNGMGLFAKKNIKRGQFIIAEKPLLRIPSYYDSQNPASPYIIVSDMLDQLVSKLTDFDRTRLFELHDSTNPKNPTPIGIVRTNGFSLGDGDHHTTAIYPIMSRINHSCRQNAHHYWNETKQMEIVHAIKDISAGEEILISYIDPYKYATRDESLKITYGFECKCEVCTLTSVELKKSDIRRSCLRTLDSEIPVAAFLNPKMALDKIEQLLHLLDEEKMGNDAHFVGRASYDAFQILYRNKQSKQSLEYWAKKVVDNNMIAYGEVVDANNKNKLTSKLYMYYKA
jgi:hypothetical protein